MSGVLWGFDNSNNAAGSRAWGLSLVVWYLAFEQLGQVCWSPWRESLIREMVGDVDLISWARMRAAWPLARTSKVDQDGTKKKKKREGKKVGTPI